MGSLVDSRAVEAICSQLSRVTQGGLADVLNKINIPVSIEDMHSSAHLLKVQAAVTVAAKKVERAFLLALEADVLPEVTRYQLAIQRVGNGMESQTESGQDRLPQQADSNANISRLQNLLASVQVSSQGQQDDMERIMAASRQIMDSAPQSAPLDLVGLLQNNYSLGNQHQVNSVDLLPQYAMTSQGQGVKYVPSMGYPRATMGQNMNNMPQVRPRNRISVDGLNTARMGTSLHQSGICSADSFRGLGQNMNSNPKSHPMAVLENLDEAYSWTGGVALNSAGSIVRGPLQNTRLGILPPIVQSRILELTQNMPIISVQDFDEKVVTKMGFLVDTYGQAECLKMLDKLALRMKSKNSVMKNGPGYLDVAVSSHLDVLMARNTFSSASNIEEYAKRMLGAAVHEELRKAVANSPWLQWDHVDQGIIQLLTKLPEPGAIIRLQEVAARSFRGVENITGCIASILNPRNRCQSEQQQQ